VSFKSDEQTLKNFSALNQLYEAVNGNFRPTEQQFWIEKMQIDGPEKIELMAECYSRVNTKQLYKEVFDDLIAEKEVYDIENLEPFLRCMESIFYQVLSAKNINHIALDQETLQEHIDRYNKFLTISDSKDGNSQMLDRRLKYIREKCNPTSEEYIKSVIAYHKFVSEQKRSAVWIEVDNSGSIQTFVQPDIDIAIDDWGRDYYLSSLHSIKTGIMERVG
jgi:hypothetical protein